MLIFGCDVGDSGGVCAIDIDGNVKMYWKMTHLYDAIDETIEQKKIRRVMWVVERAQSMPGNSGKSMFTYGMNYGKILTCIETNVIPHKKVSPAVWTKAMFTGNLSLLEGKQRNVKLLKMLAPNLAAAITPRTRPHMGICDAYLIAEYGRRYMLD